MSAHLTKYINRVVRGDALEVLKKLPADVIDSAVTDPPYGLGFMSKSWDRFTPKAVRKLKDSARRGREGCSPASFAAYPSSKSESSAEGEPYQQWCRLWARELLRVLKPGGHLLAFGGTRTYHRLVCAIEDAGFEIRDSIHWVYASGYPKSLDISKAIDKASGKERRIVARKRHSANPGRVKFGQAECVEYLYSIPSTEAARGWQGWGTALKPAHEAICVARKPLSEASVAANVLKHHTGGIDIDACRIDQASQGLNPRPIGNGSWLHKSAAKGVDMESRSPGERSLLPGRWPSNFILSHIEPGEDSLGGCRYVGTKRVRNAAGSILGAGPRKNKVYGREARNRGDWNAYGDKSGYEEIREFLCAEGCPVAELDRQSGYSRTRWTPSENNSGGNTEGQTFQAIRGARCYSDQGRASRYFKVLEPLAPFIYRSKPPTSEKNLGCQHLYWRSDPKRPSGFAPITRKQWQRLGKEEDRIPSKTGKPAILRAQGNIHCTVKGVALMEYLIRLVTPPGGIVLDPFAGSGTTGVAAATGGWRSVMIEQDPDYALIARARLEQVLTTDRRPDS